MSSIEIFVSTATLLAYTLPFILHVSTSVLVAKIGSEKDKDFSSTSNWQENLDKKKNETNADKISAQLDKLAKNSGGGDHGAAPAAAAHAPAPAATPPAAGGGGGAH